MERVIGEQELRAGTAAERALTRLLQKLVGPDPAVALTLSFASGHSVTLGKGQPAFQLEILNRRGLRAVQSLDELRICEAYMDGDINFVGDLRQAVNLREGLQDQNFWITLWRRLQPLLTGRARAHEKWVQNHYDANHIQLYFADRDYQTYTPGVFEDEQESLEAASERKHRLAFEGVGLKPGDRVLDVGFGWGSFLRYAARRGVHVTGVTLSQHQLQYVEQELVRKEGLQAELIYTDFFQYQPPEPFDAIVMLGVIEELADYPGVMQRIARWVKPGKRVYLDFMAATQDFIFPAFISKYIYQGGTSRVYLPKFIEAVTQSPFEILSLHNDRRNYYLTVSRWFERFEHNQQAIRERFGERMYRMFRLYLAGNPFMLSHPSHLTTAYRVFLELPADYQHEAPFSWSN
jgi:cyclopropane-fatty-acyl-phospholipid synthase